MAPCVELAYEPVRLVYCTDEQINDVKQLAVDPEAVIVNSTDSDLLESLDDMKDVVLIVTDQQLMRGVDYRAPKKGIHLLIMRSFEHTRAAMQGLGRVGRANDRCRRYLLADVKLVDYGLELRYLTQLDMK